VKEPCGFSDSTLLLKNEEDNRRNRYGYLYHDDEEKITTRRILVKTKGAVVRRNGMTRNKVNFAVESEPEERPGRFHNGNVQKGVLQIY